MGITVHDVIKKLKNSVGPIENTVDTLKSGSPDQKVTGIAVTFMPTYEAIKQATQLGANLLITHEGLYFSHLDDNQLGKNEVYDKKRQLIDRSGLAVFRLHDYVHRYKPDGITRGLIEKLEWVPFVIEDQPAVSILTIPEMTVLEAADYVKTKLGISFVRCLGDLSRPCHRVGILVGYRGGGTTAIPAFENSNLDLILYGEGPEWETPEYVRDSISQGNERALIILGHAESEEPGIEWIAKQLKEWFLEIPVYFISTKQNFQVI